MRDGDIPSQSYIDSNMGVLRQSHNHKDDPVLRYGLRARWRYHRELCRSNTSNKVLDREIVISKFIVSYY